MPKIIPELRVRLVAAARRRVLEDEAHDVSMRQVAEDCGTAVGTVYNYFPSKEALLAAVMMDDWLNCCRRMDEAASREGEPLAALRSVTDALRGFTARYAPMWRHYDGARDSLKSLDMRHRQIIDALQRPVRRALDRFDLCFDENLPEVLSELVLMASRSDDGFERVAAVLEKILK